MHCSETRPNLRPAMPAGGRAQSIQWFLRIIGRSERIRTSDPIVPNDVRYQAALHSDIADLQGLRARLIGARRARRQGPFARRVEGAAKARGRLPLRSIEG